MCPHRLSLKFGCVSNGNILGINLINTGSIPVGAYMNKKEKARIKKIQDGLHNIKISPETIQKGHEITRELSKISVERLYRPFDL